MTVTVYSRDEFVALTAAYVKEGLTFEARAEGGDVYIIELSGGY